jgi:hypothetical protein
MLRQKTTGDMYVFSEAMSQRSDMEIVNIPDEPATPAVVVPPAPVAKAKPAPKGKAAPIAVDPAPAAPLDTLFAVE